MIITVFVTDNSPEAQWRAELLEHSWIAAGQPGELVRLVACAHGVPLPLHSLARVLRTSPYSPHPYVRDRFPGYNVPAALLEWLHIEKVDATLLLMNAESILREAVTQQAQPGEATGNSWREWPKGKGGAPFGLSRYFTNLQAFCVNRELKPPRVRFPVLIHSSELRKIAARWLELTTLIRCEVSVPEGKVEEAHEVAYTIAAAEYGVPHVARKLAVTQKDRKADRSILDYATPIESTRGEIVWDPHVYQPWSAVDPGQARAGAGREFLERLQSYVAARESGEHLRLRRPRRRHGVREAKLPDRTLLEVPGVEEPLNLNPSAAAIWDLCDSRRSLADIADELLRRFDVARGVLCADIDLAINHLHAGGAVDLESTVHDT
jgi:hypothetical protein